MNLFDLMARIQLDTKDYEKGLGDSKKATEGFAKKIRTGLATAAKVGTAAVGAMAAGTALFTKKLISATGETASYGDNIDKMSQKIGLSAKAYQEWDYVLSQNGMQIDSAAAGLKTLTNQVDAAKNGSEDAQERFKKLGISMEDLSSMSREEIFSAAISGFQKMSESTERAALANDIFGRSGQELAPLFNQTAEATQNLKDKASELGMVMSDESVKASAAYQDSLDTLQRTLQGAKNNLAGDFLPGITSMMDGLTDIFAGKDSGFEKISKGVDGFIKSLNKKLPKVLKAGAKIISGLIKAIGDNVGDLADAATEAIMAFLDGVINNLPKLVEGGLKMIKSLITGITKNISKIVQSIVSVVIEIAKALTNPRSISELLKAAAKLMIELAKGLIQGIPELLKAIPGIIGGLLQGLIQGIAGIGDEIAKALFGIGQKTEEYSKKIGENAAKAREFGDALKNMKPQIADVNALLSKSGNTLNDLDEAIKNDEDAITTILQEALKNQQDLRDKDIRKIEEYKENIKRLEEEKLEIYRSQQLAELTKIGLEINTLDEQQAAQRLANAKAALDQINQATEEAYTNELALVEKEWATRKETDAAGYQAALDAAKLTYDQRMRENQAYYSQTTSMISEATNQWTGLETSTWAKIGESMDVFKTNSDNNFKNFVMSAHDWLGNNASIKEQYAELLSQMNLDTEAAFFEMQAQHVAGGNAMEEANKQTVNDILSAFDGLPDGLSDVGKEALLGMVGGLSDQIPELQDTSEMSAQEIVDAVKKYLKISSPSKVMADIGENAILGIMKGQNDTAPKLRKQTEVIVRGVQNTISNTVGRFRTIGGNLGNALATGFSYQRNSIISRIQGVLSGVVSSVNFFLGIRSPSRVFKRIGAYSAEGFGVGFQDAFSGVKKDVLSDFDALVTDVDAPLDFGDDGYEESIYSREIGSANQPGSRIERLLEEYLPEMIDTFSQMRVYLDTGTLVGRITPALDVSLGRETTYRARAN